MQNDEYTPEVELEETQIDTAEETVQTEDPAPQETQVDWKAEALKWQAIAKRTKAKVAPKEQLSETTLSTNNFLTREEGILIAKGIDDESLEQLKAIAKGKGVSLLDAEKDPLFTTFYEKKQKEIRSKQASLGASKGSQAKEEKPAFRPGLTREEHMALWKETN